MKKTELAKAVEKEMKEHPWASKLTATKIAKDHMRKKKMQVVHSL